MKKSIFTPIIAVLLVSCLAISVFAGTMTIDSNKTGTSENEIENTRILLLERALEPKEPYAAVKSWAEGVKTRNGALQYAVMSADLKSKYYSEFVGLGWVTGVSSPWVESYEIRELYRKDNDIYRFEVVFTYTDSTKSHFTTKEYVTANKFNDSWFISAIEKVDIGGKITKLTMSEDQKLESFFVEDISANIGYYDKANVIIGSETKIYEGYTDNELHASDLKEGTNVLVTFTGDPMIMIYPVSAEARIIRVFGEDMFSSFGYDGSSSPKDEPEDAASPKEELEETEPSKEELEGTSSIVYENTQYGFCFTLPGSWGGFSIVTDEWKGIPIGDSTGEPAGEHSVEPSGEISGEPSGEPSEDGAVETGTIINLRHPLWTEENPRQDIPIMILTIDQWNSLENGTFHIGAAPIGPTELGRSNKYVFALPARYNYAFPPGYEEVELILEKKPLKPKPLEISRPQTAEVK
jgi:hypothetical protein